MMHNVAALERRLLALEKNRGASLRFGKVTEVDGGYARVEIPDGEGVISYWLPTVQPRVLKDQDIKMPDIGEPVACLFRGQGFEEGVILGACYSPETPDPEQPPHFAYHKYVDGTELWYDREEHELVGLIEGDIRTEVKENIFAEIGENVEAEVGQDVLLTVKQNVRADVTQKVDVYAGQDITIDSKTKITLRVGSSFIIIDPTSITIMAKNVYIA